MSDKPSFFAELQRRHVYKVGAMYCVGGWLLVQVVTQVFPVFHVSETAQRVMVLAVLAGFPVALVLAWVYDLTPRGIVRTPDAAEEAASPQVRSERQHAAHMLNLVLGLLVLLCLGYIGGERIGWIARPPAATLQPGAGAAADDRSIAVLPFDNLSDDKGNAYFAEGIQDEVLTRLAKIGALRVISRTSTLQYASRPASVAEIAQRLGVANIVEGSVQKAGASVRINVQLIRAAGDTHLWAETYDRKLDDVFGVQSEVAGAIATALGATLSGGERKEMDAAQTRNPAAYDAYLRGLSLYRRGYEVGPFVESAKAFRLATQADPQFAQAWAMLSRSDATLVFWGVDDTPERRAETLHALESAERLQPDLFETQVARAYYIYRVQLDYDEARRRFEDLHRRWPNDTEVLSVLSYLLARQDRPEESRKRVEEALALDPLNLQYRKLAAIIDIAQRRFDAALKDLDGIEQIAPGEQEVRMLRAGIHLCRGELDQAAALLQPAPQKIDDNLEPWLLLARLQGRYGEAAALLDRLLAGTGDSMTPGVEMDVRNALGDLRALNGERDAAKRTYAAVKAQARAHLEREPQDLSVWQTLAHAEGGLGRLDEALRIFDRVDEKKPESKDALDFRRNLEERARLLARNGRFEPALAALHHLALSTGSNSMPLTAALLRLDPDFEAMRGDARFQQLVAEAQAAEAEVNRGGT